MCYAAVVSVFSRRASPSLKAPVCCKNNMKACPVWQFPKVTASLSIFLRWCSPKGTAIHGILWYRSSSINK